MIHIILNKFYRNKLSERKIIFIKIRPHRVCSTYRRNVKFFCTMKSCLCNSKLGVAVNQIYIVFFDKFNYRSKTRNRDKLIGSKSKRMRMHSVNIRIIGCKLICCFYGNQKNSVATFYKLISKLNNYSNNS